jgi:hypothetical protein
MVYQLDQLVGQRKKYEIYISCLKIKIYQNLPSIRPSKTVKIVSSAVKPKIVKTT